MSTTEPPPVPGSPTGEGAAPRGSGPLGPRPDAGTPVGAHGLRTELDEDIRRIESEIEEIDQLMEQVLVEIERHQGRRERIAQQLESLEKLSAPDPDELNEARDDLLGITRREMLFDAQRQVLEGKHRVLARFLQRLVEIDNSLARMIGGVPERPAPRGTAGLRPLADASGGGTSPTRPESEAALRNQEDLRRDIVRALHDGPAQSIANIGLQTEVVERLVSRQDGRAIEELGALRQLVQNALDTTKAFIFEIRPMVLDDLGLGPTIRRACADRSQRQGVPIDFDSQGGEQRLASDQESAVFRSIDAAIAGFVALRPPAVHVSLDWTGRELRALVGGRWPQEDGASSDMAGGAPPRPGETPAYLLAMMEEKRSEEREARSASRSLPPAELAELTSRAATLGVKVNVLDDGQRIELLAPIPR